MPAKKRTKSSSRQTAKAKPDRPETAEAADDLVLQAAQGHDALTKGFFAQPENARVLFQQHLPVAISSLLEFDSLRLTPGSFVRKTLQQLHSDLLFEISWKNPISNQGEGEKTNASPPAYLYLLFEHKSSPSPLTRFQLLEYMMEIWRKAIRLHQKSQRGLKAEERSPLTLPVVLPFVLSQGPERWRHSTDISDLFSLPEQHREILSPFLPKFRHLLLDLTEIPPGEAGAGTLEIVFRLMQAARDRDALLNYFDWLASQSTIIPMPLLELILIYALQNQRELDPETIWGKMKANQNLNNNTMNALQKLLEKGRDEGRKEGRDQGLDQGRKEGRDEGLEQGIVKGEWRGKIQMLRQLMSQPPLPMGDLNAMDIPMLTATFQKLEQAYVQKFKSRD